MESVTSSPLFTPIIEYEYGRPLLSFEEQTVLVPLIYKNSWDPGNLADQFMDSPLTLVTMVLDFP